MNVSGFHAGLKAALQGFAALTAWVGTLSSPPNAAALTYIDGNQRIDVIKPAEMPALLLEIGDGKGERLGTDDEVEADSVIECAIVWYENDPVAAFSQRVALPEVLMQAVMADASLGENVDTAWLSGWAPDRAVNHPIHVFRFTVSADFTVQKA